jgi:anaerobic magnesium-protoporphyrin IX monomethyl ester cyclase
MPGKNKVVLFHPPYSGPPLGAPLCLLALASPLLQAGFELKSEIENSKGLQEKSA